jgi:predicted nucleic acid-binding protein
LRVLLDTCVVSEIARPRGEQRVKDRVAALRSRDLFLSVITVGEIAKGVALLPPGDRRDGFSDFLLGLEQDYGSRILSIDSEAAHICGEVTTTARQRGKTIAVSDGLIAATALRHGLHVMTRNVSDFEDTGALLVNPWEDA